jgi:hypothetical protein
MFSVVVGHCSLSIAHRCSISVVSVSQYGCPVRRCSNIGSGRLWKVKVPLPCTCSGVSAVHVPVAQGLSVRQRRRASSTAPPPAPLPPSQTPWSSFFSDTSVRAQRRQRRVSVTRKQRRRWEDADADVAATASLTPADKDTRTVRDILFPNPYKNEEALDKDKIMWPRSLTAWKVALVETWQDYRSTWEGFWTSRGFLVEETETTSSSAATATNEGAGSSTNNNALTTQQTLHRAQDQITTNIQRNTKFVKHAAQRLGSELQSHTGIYNTQDLRTWAAAMMRLGSDCVAQFMAGYRTGRDQEVTNMLTSYFEQLQQAAQAPPRRKRRQRIINRFHPTTAASTHGTKSKRRLNRNETPSTGS